MRKSLLALALLAALQSCGGPAFAAPPPAIPAEPDTERRTTYSITTSAATLNVGFDLYGDSTDYGQWIEVWVNGVKTTAVSDWTLSSGTGALGSIPRPITNAQITFTTAQSGTIQIIGAQRPRRTSQFTENRGVTARDLNQVFTSITMMLRERWDAFTRMLRVPAGESLSTIPDATSRANKFLTFTSSGDVTVTASTSAVWHMGSGAPSASLGVASDAYLDTSTGDVYLNVAGTWTLEGNIKGPTGAPGSITSVALTMPSEFTVGGSPVTSAGTLAVTRATQTANTVMAGPNSGAAATPTFRALSQSDLPTAAYLDRKSQSFSGGATISPTQLTTTGFTVDTGIGPLQYITNNSSPSSFVISAPTLDGTSIIQIVNGSTAGTISPSNQWQFTSTSTGDAFDTTNGSIFRFQAMRINGVASYTVQKIK